MGSRPMSVNSCSNCKSSMLVIVGFTFISFVLAVVVLISGPDWRHCSAGRRERQSVVVPWRDNHDDSRSECPPSLGQDKARACPERVEGVRVKATGADRRLPLSLTPSRQGREDFACCTGRRLL